jgi:predicted component of type VI protein secretion system
LIQLSFLTGKMAGGHCDVRHFPFAIGRSSTCDFRIEEEGVWEQHLRILVHATNGFLLSVQPDAIAAVNGQLVREAVLRNGDIVSMGGSQFRFLLGPTSQRGFKWREYATWLALGALCLGQVALIYWLMSS